MIMTAPVIEVRNLKTYFKTSGGIAKAVDGVSFSIPKGGTFALVGESGCGKSVTALSVIQLIDSASGYIAGGEVLLNGSDITKLGEKEKRKIRGNKISMIFQEPMTSLNPVFTVGNQIEEAICLHQRKTAKDARALALDMLKKVRFANPEEIYDEYPHRLSGGMRQRVMIAIALSCKPDLLIADEPTTALDVTIQDEILKLIKELKDTMGTAVLLITHNLALVANNADTVCVMYAGKIVESAPTAELFKKPLHPYTQKLLSSVPAISMRGKLLDTIPGTVPSATAYADGCRFSGRCHREMQGCKTIEPVLVENEERHFIACHLFDAVFLAGVNSTHVTRAEAYLPHIKNALVKGGAIVEARGLKTWYPIRKGLLKRVKGYVKAVDGIDLTIKKGETLALVGESGSGKTTAGKSIIRLISATSGEVVFQGRDILKLGGKEMQGVKPLMQIIFQDPYSSLNPRLTVKEIIEEGLIILKPGLDRKRRLKKIGASLEQVGLSADMMSRYPHEFSGGQRQRVGIARALAVDPEFIVCDEAVSALDVSVQAQILNLLKEIQREAGLSYLFITHDLGVVEYIADEVAVMYNGKIVESGPTEEIFLRPRHEYTQKLLSAVPRL
ncbi:ABC transporter ATP-binding protein [bacterium]|nr:MAG: ABC transporter ATP-binding protein [bacterium]